MKSIGKGSLLCANRFGGCGGSTVLRMALKSMVGHLKRLLIEHRTGKTASTHRISTLQAQSSTFFNHTMPMYVDEPENQRSCNDGQQFLKYSVFTEPRKNVITLAEERTAYPKYLEFSKCDNRDLMEY